MNTIKNNIIEQLKQKYNLAADSYYTESPYGKEKTGLICPREKELRIKWSAHVPPKWYGCSLGLPTPEIWFEVIDEFLDWVVWQDRDFEILQCAMKFGRLKMYLGKISKETQLEVNKLEELLSDKFLIY